LDFALGEQQEMMQVLARGFFKDEYLEKALRAAVADKKGCTPELWQKMAKMNLMGLSIPGEYGGAGDFLDLIVVLEEMGRACLISPFFTTVVLGASAIVESGNEKQKQEYLPQIAEGKAVVTLALTEASGRYAPDAINVKAKPEFDGYVINGTKMFVPDAHTADYIICLVRTSEEKSSNEGLTLFIVDKNTPGIECILLKTISGEKQCEVVFDNVKASANNLLGEPDKGWAHLQTVLRKAAVAKCAEMIGAAQQVLNLTLEYAKERMAFGHPIGAFQSIQHRCADMLVDVDGAKLVTYQAAWLINEDLTAEKEVAIAKAWVNKAFQRVVNSSHQIHGAIGFTEDHILHFYTKKAKTAEFSYGDTGFHLDQLMINI
jgi:alkylation response protein AidB-like acyl-CoA dehydrogenase